MLTRIAADAIVLLHLGFIVFVSVGAFLVLRWKWVAWFQIPAVAWGAAIEFCGADCPLTPWEQHLRVAAGQEGYTGGFIEHYIVALIYPAGLTVSMQFWIGVVFIAINVFAYAWVLYRSLVRGRHDR
jgi:Protein of Unknown function (DUF2784)